MKKILSSAPENGVSFATMKKEAPWHQQALLSMIEAYLKKHSLSFDDKLLPPLQRALIQLQRTENNCEINSIGAKLRMLHHVELRLSILNPEELDRTELNPLLNPLLSTMLDIIVVSMIVGAKLEFDSAVYNEDFSSRINAESFNYLKKYTILKAINRLENKHLSLLFDKNMPLNLPITPLKLVTRITALLSFAENTTIKEAFTKELQGYEREPHLFKIAQAAADVAKIDITKAAPGRHLLPHSSLFKNRSIKPRKNEINTKDDFNFQYNQKSKKK